MCPQLDVVEHLLHVPADGCWVLMETQQDQSLELGPIFRPVS